MMEYLEGVKKAKTLEIGELLVQAEGTEVKVNGAVHTIRDSSFSIWKRCYMGEGRTYNRIFTDRDCNAKRKNNNKY